MENILSVLNVGFFNIMLPVLILSFLIFIHELGHYLSARWIKAEIKEFAVGMGPKLFSVRSRKTNILYSARAIPIGGFLSLVGEDENSDSVNAFSKKPIPQRFFMIVSGSIMNLLLGFIIMAVMLSGAEAYPSTRISRFLATATSNAYGLMEGDQILRINNKRINVYNDMAFTLVRQGGDPVRVTVLRNGERVVIDGVRFPTMTDGGLTFGSVDFRVEPYRKTPVMFVRQTFFQSLATVDMIWTTFFDLITGRFGLEAISGPVGVTQLIGESAREVTEGEASGRGFLFLIAVITMNLGVVNLLPIPAFDGGRIVFLAIELVRRKPINPEHEGYVHLAGIALMLVFMIFITYQDIMQMIVR